jgi:hypothetical protein
MLRYLGLCAALLCFLSSCSRGGRPYGARLTQQEFIVAFQLRDRDAYPLLLPATPENPKQLLTVSIDLDRGLLLVHRDLERRHELARIMFSTQHTPWSVTLKGSAFSRDIRMKVPDSETLIAANDIEFKN